MTVTATEASAAPRTCPTCRHTGHVTAVSARLDPDRLANALRRELRRWSVDMTDPELLLYGPDRELWVDPEAGEVWSGEVTRTAEQQLRLALVHLAAALAAGARL
ncbi:hypothetical protein [Mycobacteroides abscessus]|uniref:hypothetical protein n=1 Tax=Mycobacteroides abscessus TaxID=36809 RepID=UPI0009A8146E|nr:hypothetical protein [Mycobacteroides abscessus]MBE5513720.1 hypothetical protein [Mycobacteroides abscessus]SLC90918.1 carnitine racemase, putative [Mycobacteroides abscessus subsp. massiliense]SLE31667.1 carnitine racemase, putative [Mycobacteroides abscessus subsp. massiliense]SLE58862.1 carnitine racemase, putative [Mycobacteroides abscessus subsp. massiliense]